MGSGFLVATTAALTHDVAGVPLLWIAPLAIYLITFIVAFDHSRWYHRPTFTTTLVIAALVVLDAVYAAGQASFWQFFAAHLFGLFLAAQVCHGELYRARPTAANLTIYYLHLAAGGAFGSLVVAFLAPVLFDHFLELPILWSIVVGWYCYRIWRERQARLAKFLGLGLLVSPVAVVFFRSLETLSTSESRWADFWDDLSHAVGDAFLVQVLILMIIVVISLASFRSPGSSAWHGRLTAFLILIPICHAIGWAKYGTQADPAVILVERSFHGRVTVADYHPDNPRAHSRFLAHGSTTHGIQLMNPDYQRWPATYYGPGSGLGLALTAAPSASTDRNIGIIGLGIGTAANYGQPLDTFRFYELDPIIVEIAQSKFTALARSLATIEIKIGDGRLLLAAENTAGDQPLFDTLVIDAFSSDAVPIHLLTREAFELYESRMKPNGLMAFNVSNRFVDLRNIVLAQAHSAGLTAAVIFHSPPPADWWAFSSEWILLARDPSRLNTPSIIAAASPSVGVPEQTYLQAWTDDFSSLWTAIR